MDNDKCYKRKKWGIEIDSNLGGILGIRLSGEVFLMFKQKLNKWEGASLDSKEEHFGISF